MEKNRVITNLSDLSSENVEYPYGVHSCEISILEKGSRE